MQILLDQEIGRDDLMLKMQTITRATDDDLLLRIRRVRLSSILTLRETSLQVIAEASLLRRTVISCSRIRISLKLGMINLSSLGDDPTLEERLIKRTLLHLLLLITISLLIRGASNVVNAETTTSLRTEMLPPPMPRTKEISNLKRELITIREITEGTDLVVSATRMTKRDLFRTRTKIISVLADNNAMARDLIKKLLLPLLVLTALTSVMIFHLDSKIEDQLGPITNDLTNSAIPTMDVPTLTMADVVVMVNFLSLLDSLRSSL